MSTREPRPTAGPALWAAVPDLINRWLAAGDDYDALYKVALSLPGLAGTCHAVYCRPHAGELFVVSDAPPGRAVEWHRLLEKDGVAHQILSDVFGGGCAGVRPSDYGREPWMFVRASSEPSPRVKAAGVPFEGPSPLAAALAGSVLCVGTGELVGRREYHDTPLRAARDAAGRLLDRPPATLTKAASALAGPDARLDVAKLNDLVLSDRDLPAPVKAAAAGLLMTAAGPSGEATAWDVARVACGLGAPLGAGLAAGRSLCALAAWPPEKAAFARLSGRWAAALSAAVRPAFGF